jgi:glycosyltransferase involved in cell wall biosynthesis
MLTRRILFTSTNAMAYHFLTPHIKNLIDDGYTVELACANLDGYDALLRSRLTGKYETFIHYVRLNRVPFKLSNIKGYFDIKKLIEKGNYDLISTNEPVMGVITRLAARKERRRGTKVIYTAHGFHFFKGGPLKNWIVYYPIERLMSLLTDVLVTINKEDYERAKKFNVKKVYYIPGIGLDTKKYSECTVDKNNKRLEIGIPVDAIMLFSVGELGTRKNHEVAIRALARATNKNLFYVISGEGDLEQYLKNLCKELGIANRVKFLGYRKDIAPKKALKHQSLDLQL